MLKNIIKKISFLALSIMMVVPLMLFGSIHVHAERIKINAYHNLGDDIFYTISISDLETSKTINDYIEVIVDFYPNSGEPEIEKARCTNFPCRLEKLQQDTTQKNSNNETISGGKYRLRFDTSKYTVYNPNKAQLGIKDSYQYTDVSFKPGDNITENFYVKFRTQENPIISLQSGRTAVANIAYATQGCKQGECSTNQENEAQRTIESIYEELRLRSISSEQICRHINYNAGSPPNWRNTTTGKTGECTFDSDSDTFECEITDPKNTNDVEIIYNDKWISTAKTNLNLPLTLLINNIQVGQNYQRIYGAIKVENAEQGNNFNPQVKALAYDMREKNEEIKYTIEISSAFTYTNKNDNSEKNDTYSEVKTCTSKPLKMDSTVCQYADPQGNFLLTLQSKVSNNPSDITISKISNLKYSLKTSESPDAENAAKPIEQNAKTEDIKKLFEGLAIEAEIIIPSDGNTTINVGTTTPSNSPTVNPSSGGGSGDPTSSAGAFKWRDFTFGEPIEVTAQAPFFGEEGKTYKGLGNYLTDFYVYAIWLIAAISIIMIIYAGYVIITSSGNPEAVTQGRGIIMSALTALGLLVLAFVILRIISPQTTENTLPEAGTGLEEAMKEASSNTQNLMLSSDPVTSTGDNSYNINQAGIDQSNFLQQQWNQQVYNSDPIEGEVPEDFSGFENSGLSISMPF